MSESRLLIGNRINAAGLTTGGTGTGNLHSWPGGLAVMAAAGTFNGCTVTLQLMGPDNATLLTAGSGTTLTAPGLGMVWLPACQVQATVTGGPPSGLFVTLAKVIS